MLAVVNPATEEVLREIEEDTPESVRRKADAARGAQPAWAALPLAERIARVRRFRDLVGRERERLAFLLTCEMGKPIAHARNELNALPERIDFFLDHVEGALADEVVLRRDGMEERIRWEPLGVVANISAWNYPYFVGSNVFVPALLAGNAVLYKPSEHATLTGLAIAELMREAGVPEEVFAAVVGGGAVGAAVVAQRGIDGIYFTGSYATGRRIAEAAAGRMIRLQLELGGKDPVYLCDDVDPGAAADAMAEGAFYNAGQSCCAVERIYVHERLRDAFVEALAERARSLPVGDPLEEGTYVGPLARREQLDVLRGQVEDAVSRGGRVAAGGRRMERTGWFFEPTVVERADHGMRLMREESFGPVIGVQAVRDDDEAAALMNDTEYGLTAGVYTRDRERAERILAHVDAGTAYWNCCDRVSPRLPWTGRRHSGIGSTLSVIGIRALAQPKAWHLRGGC